MKWPRLRYTHSSRYMYTYTLNVYVCVFVRGRVCACVKARLNVCLYHVYICECICIDKYERYILRIHVYIQLNTHILTDSKITMTYFLFSSFFFTISQMNNGDTFFPVPVSMNIFVETESYHNELFITLKRHSSGHSSTWICQCVFDCNETSVSKQVESLVNPKSHSFECCKIRSILISLRLSQYTLIVSKDKRIKLFHQEAATHKGRVW